MRKGILGLALLAVLLISLPVHAQFTVSGFVEDAATGERLGNATVYEAVTGKGIVCNNYGFYSITLPGGEYSFRADYVGYHSRTIAVRLHADTVITLNLLPAGLLDEVVVTGDAGFVNTTEMGKHILPLKQVKAMPSILGESDVLKALQALPGVNSGTEGTSGFSVRGGSPEQTQIMLDGVPVYNVSHAFGYFSVFNGEALQDLTLYKSGIPARYGGRLSSILDVSMKEGNMKKLAGDFSLSPIASTLTLEGPIKKDKISFLVSGRYTWLNALLQLGTKVMDLDNAMGYGFYDLNAKMNWKINSRNRFYLSFYNGRDGLYVEDVNEGKTDKHGYNWGNMSVSARWNSVINSKMFLNVQAYYSRFRNTQLYRYYNSQEKRYDETKSYSELEDITAKVDFDYMPFDNHHLRYGMVASKKYFAPEMSYRKVATADTLWGDTDRSDLWSSELYFEDDWKIASHWRTNIGLRATGSWVGSKRYFSLEPRLALTYLINSRNSIKVSWSAMRQSLHLLTNTSLGFNTELWVPATEKVKPGRSSLTSLGYYRQLGKGIELSAEVYYNDLRNMIRYREGIGYLKQKDKSWQDYIYTGKGRAYGMDLMLNKSSGALNGWISYSLSRSERSFDQIQGGAWFPFEYDRRHKLNGVANYTFKSKESDKFIKILAVNFTYASGNYTTLGRQVYPALPLPGGETFDKGDSWWDSREYIERPNNVRLPAYHHLDIAFHLKNRKGKGDSWSFSIYNVYFRQNPGFYYRHSRNGKTEIRQMSVFPFIPSVTWSYKF